MKDLLEGGDKGRAAHMAGTDDAGEHEGGEGQDDDGEGGFEVVRDRAALLCTGAGACSLRDGGDRLNGKPKGR